MRTLLQSAVKPLLVDVRCNACGREVEKQNHGYLEDHVSLTKTWGYHSPFDGEAHEVDLCVDCYSVWIGGFEIPPCVRA